MPEATKNQHISCVAAVVRAMAMLLWLCSFALPPSPAFAQLDVAQPGEVPDFESEPDRAGLLAAIKDMTTTEPLPGLLVGRAEYAPFGIFIHVFDFGQARFEISIVEQRAPTGSRVADIFDGKDDVFVINGGFFERDSRDRLSPSGLLIINGQIVAEEHQRAGSGVLYATDDGVAIVPRRNFANSPRVKHAVQAGPLLVDPGGVRGIYKNDVERHNRSAVCLRGSSFTVFVVTGGISLFQFADLLSLPPASGGFGCDIAINLDGGPSTQAALKAGRVRREIAGGTTAQNFVIVSRR